MGAIEPFHPSLLLLLELEQKNLPVEVQEAHRSLTRSIREAVQQNYEDLEATLETLLSKVWKLRFQVLPFLSKQDIAQGLKNILVDLAFVSEKYPDLHPAAEKLFFGVQMMQEFVLKLLADHLNAFHEPENNLYTHNLPSWEIIADALDQEGWPFPSARKLIHSSLMMEVLLFAIDDVVNNKIPLESAMCYELEYQSAVAVKEYAAGLSIAEENIFWHKEPQNEVEKLLLTGPILSDTDLEYVSEKRRHLNTWK